MSVSGSGVSMGGSANADLGLLLNGGPAFEARLAQLRDSTALNLEAAARHAEAVALKAEAEALLDDARKQAAANKAAASKLKEALQAAQDAKARADAMHEKILTIARA